MNCNLLIPVSGVSSPVSSSTLLVLSLIALSLIALSLIALSSLVLSLIVLSLIALSSLVLSLSIVPEDSSPGCPSVLSGCTSEEGSEVTAPLSPASFASSANTELDMNKRPATATEATPILKRRIP